jgi:hypothetical protein
MVSSGVDGLNKPSSSPDGRDAHRGDAIASALSRIRLIVFAAVTVVSVAAALGYAALVVSRAKAAAAAAPVIPTASINALPGPASGAASPAPQARPYVLFRSTALGDTYGRLGVAYLDDLGGQRLVSTLQCERVHFASGHGICLEARRKALTTYHAHIFDRNFTIRHSHALPGAPSRARMSSDGRLAAVTVFVTGHSYASTGFVTRTLVIDAVSGAMLAEDLERFEVLHEGEVIKAIDFNFWGVTFTRDGQSFYATLGTAGKTLLVEGNLAARRMRVLRDGVECPSLSPDNTKIAFKRRQAGDGPGRFVWGLHVLDLASGKETALSAETRNVDDQVEWLGNEEVLYAMPVDANAASAATNLWAIAVDAASAPRLFMPMAFSPAMAR